MLGTTSIIASHARLYFNRGSSETICYVKAEGLNPWWQLHQSRNPQQLNGCNTRARTQRRAETFELESRRRAEFRFPTEFTACIVNVDRQIKAIRRDPNLPGGYNYVATFAESRFLHKSLVRTMLRSIHLPRIHARTPFTRAKLTRKFFYFPAPTFFFTNRLNNQTGVLGNFFRV